MTPILPQILLPEESGPKPKEGGSKDSLTFSVSDETTEELLYEFLRGKTPQTEKSYRADVKNFFKFTNSQFGLPKILNDQANFAEIKRVHIIQYKNHLESVPSKNGRILAPNSINRRLSSIASFFQFLLQREIIEKDPVQFCTRPKRNVVRPTEALDDREMKELFTLVLKKAPPMHACLILLMFTSGMRNAELRNIKLGDFNDLEGVRVLRYIGKGQKQSEIAIHPATAYYLDEYLKWMVEQGRPVSKQDYLFQPVKRRGVKTSDRTDLWDSGKAGFTSNSSGTPSRKLSPTALGYIVKKWTRKINPSKRITPHSGRASFISSLLANGVDLYAVSQAVSHSDTRVTQRYDKRAKNFKRSPVFSLNLF